MNLKHYLNRQESNEKLLELLKEALNKNPDLRFIQALWAIKVIDMNDSGLIYDRFYEEPSETLKRIKG